MINELPINREATAVWDLAYARNLQCAQQWRSFLWALGQEFVHALPEQELQILMARIGARFADRIALPACTTLQALQQAMNQVWTDMQWGQVQLQQTASGIEIEHRFSPLAAAFGEATSPWTVGFLQGVYQQWMKAAGAAQLQVQVIAPVDSWGTARLCLSVASSPC